MTDPQPTPSGATASGTIPPSDESPTPSGPEAARAATLDPTGPESMPAAATLDPTVPASMPAASSATPAAGTGPTAGP